MIFKKASYKSLTGIIRIIIPLSLSLCVTISILLSVHADTTHHQSYYGVLPTLIFFILYYILYKTTALALNQPRRLLFVAIVGGMLFSLALVTGTNVMYHSIYQLGTYIFELFSFTFLFSSLITIFLSYLPDIQNSLYSSSRFIKNRSPSTAYFLFVWLVIFLSYIPVLLATYPGLFTYDVGNQLTQYFRHWFFNNHPPLHTIYLGVCFTIGRNIFHSDSAGMLIYSISQMSLLSASFSYCCYFLAKHKAPFIIQILSIIFFAFFPMNAIYAVTTTKDVLFSAAFLLMVLFTYDMVLESDKFFSSAFLMTRYVAIVLLVFLLRKNGFYVFLLCIPFLLFTCRKHMRNTICICSAAVLLWMMISGPIYYLLKVHNGDMKEALSIPIHQITYTVGMESGNFTNDEKNEITKLMPNIKALSKKSGINTADFEKADFNTNVFKKEKMKYVKLFVDIGLRYPADYFYAFINNTLPAWYPDFIYSDRTLYQPASENRHLSYAENGYAKNGVIQIPSGKITLSKESKIPWLNEMIESLAYQDGYQYIPVLSILFSPGFIFWLLIFTMLVCFYQKKYKNLVPLFMLFALWISVLFGPATLPRYIYPITVCLPVMCMMIFDSSDKASKNDLDLGSEPPCSSLNNESTTNCIRKIVKGDQQYQKR